MPIEELFSRPCGVGSTIDPYTPPPAPPAPAGWCYWCRAPLLRRDGKPAFGAAVHTDCLMEAFIVYDPSMARRAVMDRANGRCEACGGSLGHGYEGEKPWEVDHVIPLADALPHAGDPWWPWRMSNLRALCPDCYAEKTAQDAAKWIRRREGIWPVGNNRAVRQGGQIDGRQSVQRLFPD